MILTYSTILYFNKDFVKSEWANSIKVSVELPKTEKQNLSTRFTRKSWKKISEELPKIPSQSWKKRKTQQVAVQSMGDNTWL